MSTLLVVVNRVLRTLNQETVSAGQIDTASIDPALQFIIDEVNTVQIEDARLYDWTFLEGQASQSNAVNSRSMVLSSLSNIDFMRPFVRVRDTVTPRILRECGLKEWHDRTWTTLTGTPMVYRKFGVVQNSVTKIHHPKIELDPQPSTARSYQFDYWKVPIDLTASTDISVFPDEVMVNGVLARHTFFDGNDPSKYQAAHDLAIERLMTQIDDGEDYTLGGSGLVDERSGAIFSPSYKWRD